MKVEPNRGFTRDLRRIRSSELRQRVLRKIEELEEASAITEVTGVKKMTGEAPYYRIRIGDYRLGLAVEGDEATLLRFLHRSEIYQFFP